MPIPARSARQPLSLKAYALGLLGQREHSELELRRKLQRHLRSVAQRAALAEQAAQAAQGVAGAGTPATVESPDDPAAADAARIDDTIAWLRAHKYLSDARFVESRIHARAARYGNQRIRQELAQHGLELDETTRQALKDSEMERAQAVWQRKFGAPAGDAGGRARQARFLAQRGFSPELVVRLLRSVQRGSTDTDDPELD